MKSLRKLISNPINGEINNHRVHPESATVENGASNGNGNVPMTLMSVNSDPTFTVYAGARKKTIAELIKYEEEYGKTDFEIMQRRRSSEEVSDDNGSQGETRKFEGFGWITGVLIRCVLCIFGATLFLRMSWIAGQSGVVLGMCVILLSWLVVVLTAVSMSAIATNGEIKNGGCYYLISRSLGPEYGGAIGLIFYIANTVNASMNCVGLAEALVDILNEHGIQFIDGGINDIRVYGVLVCLLLQSIIFIGTEFENKTQILLLVTITCSIISHFIGTLFPLSEEQITRGITGYSWQTFFDNLWPDYRNGESFISTFGVYFPAMTGIMGGANMSGDLRDPSKSIPKGTMWAIAVTTATYAWCMLVTAATTVRDASGMGSPMYDSVAHHFVQPECRVNNSCEFGLANDFQIMTLQGAWSPLIIAGILATTLSSASGCLIGAPRVFQALCEDKLFPGIKIFAKGHGKNNDPFRAYFLTFAIATAVILIGSLNAIAILITNFFLAAFAITNFACFDATMANSPGFRPGFRYYNKWLSLFGSILCITIMFVMSWQTSLVTFIIFAILFMFIKHNKSHINWGSSTEANRYRKALTGLLKVTRQADHVKNYRPQVLVLTGNPAARQDLVDFSYCITKGTNLLVCGHVIPYQASVAATSCIRKLNNRFTDWLHEQRIKGFYCGVADTSLRSGVQTLIQVVGLGKMQPNILMLGYKHRWTEHESDSNPFLEYCGVIHDAFEANLSLCIFRNENHGLDHSAILSDTDNLFLKLPDLMLSDQTSALNDDLSRGIAPKITRPKATNMLARRRSNPNLMRTDFLSQTLQFPSLGAHRNKSENMLNDPRRITSCRTTLPPPRYRSVLNSGFVDVWWLFEDGGLILLLAFLLTSRPSFLENCKLRIFTICNQQYDPNEIKSNLERKLKKFRIHYSDVYVIFDSEREHYAETVDEYNMMLSEINKEGETPLIPEELLESCKTRTERYMREREYLLEHSSASNFVIITLPVASSNVVLSPLYMLWLELLSRDMPPTLFVRGNQSSVITYYS